MATIDADAHVVECEETWKYMSSSSRPVRVELDRAGRKEQFWVIGNQLVSVGPFSETDAVQSVRDMTNTKGRLEQMDEIGTDHQVVFPTVFLFPLTKDPGLEEELCRSYNRWIFERVSEGGTRFSWAVIPPTIDVNAAIDEIRFGHENGASAVFWRGIEREMLPSDPYFEPIFAEIDRLGMTVAVHAANGNPYLYELFPYDNGIFRFKVPGITAFHNVLSAKLPEKYPEIRWGFVELCAQWVPYVLHDFVRRGDRRDKGIDPTMLMAENHMYVACQTDDDLSYVHKYAGDFNLVCGTDFGHADTASELLGLQRLRESRQIAAPSIERILYDNPRALYKIT